jgi:hypothetical protein
VTDWRWYKDIHGCDIDNRRVVDAWEHNLHNFIDYRLFSAGGERESNLLLYKMASALHEIAFKFDGSTGDIANAADIAERIGRHLDERGSEMRPAAAALHDAANGLRELPAKRENARFGEFERMFGRGMQYLSFIRKTT